MAGKKNQKQKNALSDWSGCFLGSGPSICPCKHKAHMWLRPQLGRQQRELTKLIRGGWHVKVSCGSAVGSITYVSFVAAEVAPLFVNWWRFALPSLWVEALTCGGPNRERKLPLCLRSACCSSCPSPSLNRPKPSPCRRYTVRRATPVKRVSTPASPGTSEQPAHLLLSSLGPAA